MGQLRHKYTTSLSKQGLGPRGLSSPTRTKFGGLDIGLDAVLVRLGVLVSVANIYANVIRTIAKIHLV